MDPTNVTTSDELGALLRRLRTSTGLSTWDIDQRTRHTEVRLTRSKISKVERGELPTLTWLRAFLNVCGVDTGSRRYRDWERAWATAQRRIAAGPVAVDSQSFVVPRQLPAVPRHFVGRQAELDHLNGLITHPGRVAVVQGAAGIGKTTLALHWAHAASQRFPDGQFYLNLRGFNLDRPTAPPEALRELLDGLNVSPGRIPSSFNAQVSLFRSLVAGKRILIVLDNAATSDQVRPLLPGAPTCVTIVTSRNRLAGLVAREGALPLTLDTLSKKESRSLLARTVGVELLDSAPDASTALLALCAGLPLSLAIIAARVVVAPTPSLERIAAEAEHSRSQLSQFELDDRESDLRTVFSGSYRALDEPAARLFRLLGLNTGADVSVDAAASLLAADATNTRALLTVLTNLHLVEEYRPGRFRMHDLLRAYAFERAQEEETDVDRLRAQSGLVAYFLQCSLTGDRLLDPLRETFPAPRPDAPGPPPRFDSYRSALAWFQQEHKNLSAAARLASTLGLHDAAFLLPWSMTTYLHRQGYWPEYAELFRLALDAGGAIGDPRAQGVASRNIGNALAQLGKFQEALEHQTRALTFFVQAGDIDGQARTERAMGFAREQMGDHASAVRHARAALAHYQDSGNLAGQAQALNALGWYLALQGCHTDALHHCAAALKIFETLDDPTYQAHTLDSIGYSLHQLGRHSDASERYEQAIEMYRRLGDRYYEAETLHHLGDCRHASGDTDGARHAWRDALEIFAAINHPRGEQVRAKLSGDAPPAPQQDIG
ncbi:tetratricopeptide repeat protein [Micromonospora sp. LAH09]|uniref:ATP-binding protein n=1 Tax=Micromonospora cabrerizensis TaxID=2911213 RepID=UPI001EE89436|nr:tetratricopeptide repeat protein [Micromonospora cabrerizensis]MCG5468098.1 tetratricopeptide repeat protein [Micromonospora cabrerizensis]